MIKKIITKQIVCFFSYFFVCLAFDFNFYAVPAFLLGLLLGDLVIYKLEKKHTKKSF